MPPESRARFESLDARVKSAFMDGELNPALVYLAVTRPDYFALTLRLDSAEVQTLVSEMARQLGRVKEAAAENNASVLVVSVPYGVYVSQAAYESRRRLGFRVTPEMLSSDAGDEAVAEACRRAGLPFHDVTATFRRASADLDLFFELDGHFNAAGYRLFGESVALAVEKMMTPKPRPTP